MTRAALLLVLLVAGTSVAEVKTTTVSYLPAGGANGYRTAEFTGRYAFHECQGELYITTELVGKVRLSRDYVFNGDAYEVPPGLSPTNADQGTFSGAVFDPRLQRNIGYFQTLAGNMITGHGCLGDKQRIARLADLGIDTKDRPAVDRFLNSLVVNPNNNPTYRNANVESWIQQKLDRERREKAKAEEDVRRAQEEARKANEAKLKAEEDARRAEENARRAEENARRAEEDARRAEELRKANENKPPEEPTAANSDGPPDTPEDPTTDTSSSSSAGPTAPATSPGGSASSTGSNRTVRSRDTGCALIIYPEEGGSFWMRGDNYYACTPEQRAHVDAVIAQQDAELERKAKAEQMRQTITTLSGGTPEGAMVVTAAAAIGVLGAPIADGLRKASDALPMHFDLEAAQRFTFSGNAGYGFAFRVPGFFYSQLGFVSYELSPWDRVNAATFGLGLQLPLTWRWTVRAVEAGVSLGSVRHVVDEATLKGSFNIRTGVVFRIVSGLATSATIGFDTLDNQGFADFGVLWRFDIEKSNRNRRYLIR
jgi:hypothetical protein